MTICNVLKSMTIGENTAVVVDGPKDLFYNGLGILDENGTPYEVLSVGMDKPFESDSLSDKTSLLLNGSFLSKKIFI